MVQSAAQKPQSPPPPPPPKPAEQPAASGEAKQTQQAPAQGQAQGATGASAKPAAAPQTGYSAQDGFETQAPRSASAAGQPQGDTFEAALAKPSGGGAVAPATGTEATGAGTGVASGAKVALEDGHLALTDAGKTAMLEKARPAVVEDPAKAPDPKDPTAGMTGEQQTAYDALSPEDKERYNQLHEEAATNRQTRALDGAQVASPDSSVEALRALLTSGRLGDFFKVEDALGSGQAKTDLHELLFQGQLPGPKNNVDLRDTLSILSEVADKNTGLLEGINRQGLLGDLLHDLNHPEEIKQAPGSRNCSGGDAAVFLATNCPSEYARQVAGLAEHGEVTLEPWYAKLLNIFGGGNEQETIKFEGKFDPNSPASATEQLFGGGFTESADEASGTSIFDRVREALGLDHGVTGAEFKDSLNAQPDGGNWDEFLLPPAGADVTPEQRQQAKDAVQASVDNASVEHPVMVNLDGHWIEVVGKNEDGTLQYYDPKEGYDPDNPPPPVTVDDVMEKGSAVVYQPSAGDVNVPEYMKPSDDNKKWDREGGGGSASSSQSSGGGSTK